MTGSRNSNIVLDLYKTNSRVFTLSDIAMLTEESNFERLNQRVNYQVRQGNLLNPRKGIYATSKYTPEELACRLYAPSYLSLEYILQQAGIIFQFDSRITMVSYLSRGVTVGSADISYRKIKNEILVDTRGIIQDGSINKATPERAYLDMSYLNGETYVDNFQGLDRLKIAELLPIYRTVALEKRIKKALMKYGQQ